MGSRTKRPFVRARRNGSTRTKCAGPITRRYFLSLTDPAAAIPEWRLAAELGGDRYPVARLRLGAALLDLGRIDEAETEFRRVLDAEPNNSQRSFCSAARRSPKASFKRALIHWACAAKSPSTRKGALTA